jgi:hypothetical protein
MNLQELSLEALRANIQYHHAVAEKAKDNLQFNLERAKVFEDELKRREAE